MATETLVFDPLVEDAGNAPLDMLASPYAVTRFQTPTPPLDVRLGEPVDADGEPIAARRYKNRRILLELEIVAPAGPTRATVAQEALAAIAMKVAKINREGGTLRRVLPSGLAITFDLLAQTDEIDPSWDIDWDTANRVVLSLAFTAKPFGRGDEETRTLVRETTLPVLVWVETGIDGDAPAAARLVIKDDQGVDQQWCAWGLQVLTYDPASTAALHYEAEACTPIGSAAVATLAAASGGRVVTSGSLMSAWCAVLSTQQSGGAHLTHVGEYRVLARILRPGANTGTVSVALEWASGDFLSFTRNDAVVFDVDVLEDQLLLIDLGIVSIVPALQGTQRWEGRIVARSTWGSDRISIDNFVLIPTERSGEAAGLGTILTPTGYLGLDTFGEADGVALAGQAAEVGGRWAGAGDTDDFAGSLGNMMRDATGDTASTGRWAILGSSRPALVAVEADILGYPISDRIGPHARYVDTSNWLMAALTKLGTVVVLKRIAGTITTLSTAPFVWESEITTVRLEATADGSWAAWVAAAGSDLGDVPLLTGIDADLATGGVLDDGQFGIYEEFTHVARVGEDIGDRGFAAFRAWMPSTDAAMLASMRLQVGTDAVIRESSGGGMWPEVSSSPGDLLTIPPAGAEGRSARFIVKGSRSRPGVGPDSVIDDISAQLFVTPRYLVVP